MVQPNQPAPNTPYPHLTAPLNVGPLTLRNRLVMGSMHAGLEDRTKDIPQLAAYLARRAEGGTGLIVTGGYAPNVEGWLLPAGSLMASKRMARNHRHVTDAIHEHNSHVVLQLLHAGRYGYHPLNRSASTTKSPITPFKARKLTGFGVRRTINAYVRAAKLAKAAGYDGIEIMGSEGYLINQFLAARTNHRTDAWGGSAEKRMRFPVEIVRRIRDEVGADFLLQYRISLLDLVEDGQTWDETIELAGLLSDAGVDVFNTGIGWHEARVPTIVTSVPRAAFAELSGRLRRDANVTVCASNRINSPQLAEAILERGDADLISMARPLLADPDMLNKAAAGRADEVNTCIACNQACLDHTFANKRASCLVNPVAGRELELFPKMVPPRTTQRIAVIGAGVAGLAFAEAAANRGHTVEIFEASQSIGGQFRLAARIPGKEDYAETLRYFRRRLEVLAVPVHLGTRVDVDDLGEFDHVVVASGVTPRVPSIAGIDHPSVIRYDELLSGAKIAGERVAILGAGGIGIDVAEFLTRESNQSVAEWSKLWGVADPAEFRAGLTEPIAHEDAPGAIDREVHILQRKETRIGKNLGKTTGWVHRAELKKAGVHHHTGVSYRRIDDEGLHITENGEDQVIPVDSVILCTGQVSELAPLGRTEPLDDAARAALPDRVTVIGGADVAAELDAKRAIKQAVDLAMSLG
ncbi:NADPH-dependent 2,4-dienoyl-CoA reductase [Corynebacterium sp. TAE3-ERU12]|uniref:NADPH-dependent 2,4-dienoyl-CoA reductase n=1 Tax=Corynebacterium sp. TAE3-ERU12 TaxID=2849491 RepID=UPI001C442E92|nr:NADPH-dependent 2,4-dienoyl-CoA reductase [Corynebacterium sp. TAE3-ERU12]MBV7294388.1 NADPH-dependent 2,4-dienoyl-CoA reductase [Corynebacterium sp. TAE3-ERU12]